MAFSVIHSRFRHNERSEVERRNRVCGIVHVKVVLLTTRGGEKMKYPLTIFGLLCIAISLVPLFLMAREKYINHSIGERYDISHTYMEQGFPSIINVPKIEVNGFTIEIKEELTGKKAPQTWFDVEEGVEGGEIVRLQLLVDGKEVSDADEIWLSNRDPGSRYWSWLDVLLVKDKQTGQEQIAIVQRLSEDTVMQEDYRWKVIYISEDGGISEEQIEYGTRSEHPLAVRLIVFSGTSLIGMGYYSDLLHYYPSLYYPVLYPFGTTVIGGILILLGFFLQRRKGRQSNAQ